MTSNFSEMSKQPEQYWQGYFYISAKIFLSSGKRDGIIFFIQKQVIFAFVLIFKKIKASFVYFNKYEKYIFKRKV